MKRFVVPPTWPSPPRRHWVPPKSWRPHPSWPPPPEGWRFWVDGKGNPVRGPVGRYGGPTRKSVYAGAGGLVLLLGVSFWALSAVGLFGGDSGSQAVHVADDSTPRPTPTATATPTAVPSKVAPSTPPPPPVQKTTVTPTRKPTPKPTRTRTTEREDRPEPTPTRTSTTKKTVRPPRPSTSTPPTREELLRQYCIQQGWDPEWCDPANWPQNPADDPRNEEP
ncbi:hypothetical protein [Kribbella swartbergensis]